ncbi:hypothetical protein [Synechocystis salina]|jgi:hypothetical protein|uniref:hypothetical protein n=1 Tax=Synechocystis salina TaxID=945780 RepID=UPI001D141069|nr:hypothetical protein [Synechocystis salina]
MAIIETDLGRILERIEEKIDSNQSRTEEKLNALDNRLSKLEGAIQAQQPYIQKIPDLAEKVGELKNWRQISIGVLLATVGAIIGYLSRNIQP